MTSVATQHKSADSAALIAECHVAAVLILHVHEAKSKFMAQNRGAARHMSESELRGTLRPLPEGQAAGTTSHLSTESACTHA